MQEVTEKNKMIGLRRQNIKIRKFSAWKLKKTCFEGAKNKKKPKINGILQIKFLGFFSVHISLRFRIMTSDFKPWNPKIGVWETRSFYEILLIFTSHNAESDYKIQRTSF